MSFDHLYSKIKAKKCPLCPTVSPLPGMDAEAAGAFCPSLLEAVSPLVPAARFPLTPFAALGWKGLRLLEELLSQARQGKLFTLIQSDLSALEEARSLLAQPFEADCLIVSGYPGGPDLPALLDVCQREDKCLFLLARAAHGGELQDLVAGDRLVYQVVGDLAHRLGSKDLGRLGYSRAGILLEGVYPSDLRDLRKRWEGTFLLVDGSPLDARFAFDKYGRGAMVLLPPLPSPEEAREQIRTFMEEFKELVTLL